MVVTRENLKWEFWEHLAKIWRSVLDSYIENSDIKNLPRDLPYWHCERASTGFLVGAAWKMGAIAIEEYYTERVYSNTKKRTVGHCDLWVRFKDISFSAEVKQLWPKVYNKESIQKKIEKAEEQLESLSKEDKRASSNLFSVCFVSPRLEDKAGFDIFGDGIRKDFENKDSRIFCYDQSDLSDDVITWKNNGEKYPGVIMLVKLYRPNK